MDSIYTLLKYIFLGLLQGFTEPIPVSSSGHLVIVEHLMGLHIEGLGFEVMVNFASLLAVLLIYRKDLIELATGGLRYLQTRDAKYKAEFMFIVYLVLATIPAAVIGVLFNDYISGVLKGLMTIGVTLIITGIALWLIRNLRGGKGEKELTMRDALIVGLAQAVALIPGISRSGATIVAAMGLGMKQQTALKFSFFMYIPVSLGGMILEAPDMLADPQLHTLAIPYLAAFVASLMASYYSLRWFMGVMARGRIQIFSYYAIIAGISVLLFL